MRHRKSGRKFNRVASTRRAFIKSLERSLITHRQIMTTAARAKTLRQSVEKLVTAAKNTERTQVNTVRLLGRRHDAATVAKLRFLAQEYPNRQGGYTKIIKAPPRQGDGAPMAIIKFV